MRAHTGFRRLSYFKVEEIEKEVPIHTGVKFCTALRGEALM